MLATQRSSLIDVEIQERSNGQKRSVDSIYDGSMSKKKLKKLLKNPKKCFTGNRKMDYQLCNSCQNPKGSKCTYELCKSCCRTKCLKECINCPGHKLQFIMKNAASENHINDKSINNSPIGKTINVMR